MIMITRSLVSSATQRAIGGRATLMTSPDSLDSY